MPCDEMKTASAVTALLLLSMLGACRIAPARSALPDDLPAGVEA